MIKVTRKRKARLPEIRLSKSFWDEIGGLIASSIVTNVATQRKAEGGRLKVNAPSTREAKARKGRPQLSLVDEKHRFVRSGGGSFKVTRFLRTAGLGAVRGVVVGPATAELKEIVGHVARMGHGGYIGLNRYVKQAIGVSLRRELQRYLAEIKRSYGRGSR